MGVFPTNDSTLVEKLGGLLGADLEQVFKLINLDEESSKRHPFPCPTSFRTALTHYVDICAPVKSHVLKAIAEYTTDEVQKERLLLLSTASEEGLVSILIWKLFRSYFRKNMGLSSRKSDGVLLMFWSFSTRVSPQLSFCWSYCPDFKLVSSLNRFKY